MDQPVGTGFSYVNTDSFLHELPEVFPFTYELIGDGIAILKISGQMD